MKRKYNHNINENNNTTNNNNDDLKREIKRVWVKRKIEVIPIVIGVLGAVSRKQDNWTEKLDVYMRVELLQKKAMLGTARILRRSLES